MSDLTVNVTVTLSTNHWAYGLGDSQATSTSLTITVKQGEIKTILVNVQPSIAGDSVVLNDLDFVNLPGPPNWCKITGQGTSSLTIKDDNSGTIEGSPTTGTFHFLFQATYTPQGGSPVPLNSPDPTIINTGTGGERTWTFPST